MSAITQSSTANLLLRALDPADFLLLAPDLKREELMLGAVLFEPDVPIERVHFVETGVASVVSEHEGGEQVEVGLFGRDGMSGSAVLLGAGQTPQRSMVQVGDAVSLSIASDRLLDACRRSLTLQPPLLRFVHMLMIQASYTAATNAHYALPERLARWLLMCHDRVDGDRLELTHEFMAMMLAVRRSGVTVTLHTLEATGALRATRGLVTILDRARLEEIAGESYGAPEHEYRRLIGPLEKGGGRGASA